MKEKQIVHIVVSENKFVRGEFIKDVDEQAQIQATDLLGSWKKSELPRYSRTGDIYRPSYSRLINTKMLVNYNRIYESDECKKGMIDPAKLEPVDLTLPPLTNEQKESARLWIEIFKVRAIIERQDLLPSDLLKHLIEHCEKALK